MTVNLSERFAVPDSFVIPEDDDARLRTLLNLTHEVDGVLPLLPASVVRLYYAAKRCHDILGIAPVNMVPSTLVTVVLQSILCEAPETVSVPAEPGPSFREVVRQRKVRMGALVAAVWRNETVGGYFSGFDGDSVIVQIKGMDRIIPLADVRLAGDKEFEGMKRNVND